MKNPDQFSRRFLAVSLGLSAILLSASLFLFSLNAVGVARASNSDPFEDIAKLPSSSPVSLSKAPMQDDEDIMAIYAFGIGIRDGNLYFGILYNNNTIGLHKSPADGEDVLDW